MPDHIKPKPHQIEVWAQLFLCPEDCSRIREFFVARFGVKPNRVIRNMHLTVYHARRPMPGIRTGSWHVNLILRASETRFMVMTPGGENPRPDIDPAGRSVGVRVHKRSAAMRDIQDYRKQLLKHETMRVLGPRSPSTATSSAFGARYFQPHMVILRPGSGIGRDLSLIGGPFRETLGELRFDRFVVEIARKQG